MQRVTICTIKYFIVRIIVGTRINSYFIGIGTKSHQRDSSTVIIGFAKVAYRFLKIRPYTSYVLLVCGCNCYGICLERSFDFGKHLCSIFNLLQVKPRTNTKFLQSIYDLGIKAQRRVLFHEWVCLGEILLKRHGHTFHHWIHILRCIVSALGCYISCIAISRKRISLHCILNLLDILIVALSLIKDANNTPAHCCRHFHKSGSWGNSDRLSLLGKHVCAAIGDKLCCIGPCVEHLDIAESVFNIRKFEHNWFLIHIHP